VSDEAAIPARLTPSVETRFPRRSQLGDVRHPDGYRIELIDRSGK
jgi:hypothetical protein